MDQYANYNSDIKETICANIKKFRKQKKISTMELAEKLGLSVEHLKRMEAPNDRNNISLMTLYKISIILDVRIDQFFVE